MVEIWSLEVPFQDSLSSFSHEVQLAEAISLGTIRLNPPAWMPTRVGPSLCYVLIRVNLLLI